MSQASKKHGLLRSSFLRSRAQPRASTLRSRAQPRASTGLALAVLSLGTGCNWTKFDDFEKKAPIRVSEAPSGYQKPGFGNVLTSLETGPDDDRRSIAVASAGRDSPVVFERIWEDNALISDAFTRCKSKDDCKNAAGLGETLIPFAHWALHTPQQQDGCIFAPGVPKAYVFCDSDTSANQSFDLEIGEQESNTFAAFGGAGLPPEHPLGVVLLGAYSVSTRTQTPSAGRIFYQLDFQPPGERSDDDEVPKLRELPVLDPSTQQPFADAEEGSGDLGFALATAQNADGLLLIAISQPARQRVIIASYDDSLPGEPEEKIRTHACLNRPNGDGSFGTRLALGDVNDDGRAEVVVGSDLTDSAERVFLYRGTGLPGVAGDSCPAWGNEPVELTCKEGVRGVSCAQSAFGASLAFGDVNGDGTRDLLVGAPNADVEGAQEAGAVWIFPGGPDSEASGGLDLDTATNLYANKKSRAHLGTSLAAVRTRDRDEPVAGAPGEERLYTFLCSALEDDVSGQTLCLPK